MAKKYNLFLDQGTTFSFEYTALDDTSNNAIDLTDYTITAGVRRDEYANSAVAFTTNGNANGILTISMSANTTAALRTGVYLYDVRLVESATNAVSRLLEGQVLVRGSITRS